jgi:diketogulonate reductase-like aldo/keto reductase
MIAFSPFGSPDLPWGEKLPPILEEKVIKEIAENLNRTPALVVLRWLLQRKVATVPKVSSIIRFCNYNFYNA